MELDDLDFEPYDDDVDYDLDFDPDVDFDPDLEADSMAYDVGRLK